MVQDWCPRHSKPSVSFSFGVGRMSLFSILALWGNKNWPPQYECEKYGKFSKSERCKGLQMVQFDSPWHLKSSVSSSFKVGWIPFSHYWPSGVIRIGLPSMKVKKFETFQNKRGSTCCKWPNLNAPGTQTPLYHPIPELTKPNLTTQQSSLPIHFAPFHPLLSATAIPHWIHQFSSDHWS